jgi:hypothetical protein
LLHTQTQESSSLARQLELYISRARDLALEKDNLQQAPGRAHLDLKQVPTLQEKVKQSVNQIKSLELKLSNQDQEKKKLLRDLDSKRLSDIDVAQKAGQVEAEKQLEDALNKSSQQFGEHLLQCLKDLSLPSDELKEQFSQACSEQYAEGCYLNDLFGILQQLLDHIYTNHSEQMVSVERELKEKAIKAQDLGKTNQALSTKLANVTLAAGHLKSSFDSLQVTKNCNLIQVYCYKTRLPIGSCDRAVRRSCSLIR